MDDDAPRVGPILQAERKARHLTLEQLANLSGVSRSMLSQIERNETNPTFAVLWGLTRSLGLEFGDLVSGGVARRSASGVDVVSVSHTPEIRSPDGSWRMRILSPPSLAGRTEWYEVELAPGARLTSKPHTTGTMEHLTAYSDGLVIRSAETSQAVKSGETARYRADVEHEIANRGRRKAQALLVVLYR